MTELKPCPCCNSGVRIYHECTIGTPQYRIKCGVCGIQTDLGSKEYVISRWNTRHEPDGLPSWVKEAIETRIEKCRAEQDKITRVGPSVDREFWYNRIESLKWVLTRRKPEET